MTWGWALAALRIMAIALVTTATAQMLVINYRMWLARHRPAGPPRLLFIHVLIISLRDAILSGWAVYEVARRLDVDHYTWRAGTLLLVGILGNLAFYTVGKVIRTREALADRVQETLHHDGH